MLYNALVFRAISIIASYEKSNKLLIIGRIRLVKRYHLSRFARWDDVAVSGQRARKYGVTSRDKIAHTVEQRRVTGFPRAYGDKDL